MIRNDNLMYVGGFKSCTDNLKIKPAYRYLEDFIRDLYGYQARGYRVFYQYFYQWGKLETWIGFAKGEESRMAAPAETLQLSCERPEDEWVGEEGGSVAQGGQLSLIAGGKGPDKKSIVPVWRQKTVFHRYPLIELGWDRAKCQEMIASYEQPVPFPSNCMMCPFQNEPEIVYLYRTKPDVFARWCEREAAKLKKNATREVNYGVKGNGLTLERYLEKALKKYGDWTIEQLADYKFTHGHCVKSRY